MAAKRYQEGTVEKTGKDRDKWTGYFYVYDENGKRHRRSVPLGLVKELNEKQARGLLRPIVEKETKQPIRATGEDTLEWFYWKRFSPAQTQWKRNTRRLVDGAFRLHVLPRIGKTKLKEIDRYQVISLFEKLSVFSQTYLDTMRTYLKAVFEWAIEDDLIAKNPAKKVLAKTTCAIARSERTLTMDEIRCLFAQLDPRDRLFCRFALILGLRPGEICGLTWNHYDPMKKILTIDQAYNDGKIGSPKTKSSIARIPLPPSLTYSLDQWRSMAPPSEYLFTTKKGRPLDPNYVQHYTLVRAATRAGIMPPRPKGLPKGTIWKTKETAVTFQAMRRTCATEAARTGTVKDIQTILRHAKGNAAIALKHYIKPIDETVMATMLNVDAMVSAAVDAPKTLTM